MKEADARLRYALRYAEIGWPVFPCNGKKPLTAHGFHDATTDSDTITEWWGKNPMANIGVAVPANLVVVDVDSEEALERLRAEDRELPSTTRCQTGRGFHLYYRVPEGELEQRALTDGIDVRVPGKGYVIVPPSTHPDTGRLYEWVVKPLQEVEAPPWILQVLAPSSPTSEAMMPRGFLAGVPQGARNTSLFKSASRLRGAGVPIDLARELLLKQARECHPPLSERETLRCLESAYGRYEPEADLERRVVRLLDVEPETVDFLFKPYVPRGKLTALVGDPGQGKSFIVAAMATALSLGRGLPGGEGAGEPMPTLIFTAEDGLADTLRPRLDAMEADVGLIYAYSDPVDLSCDEGIEFVRKQVRELQPALVAVDPIVAYVGAATDTYRANQVRAIYSRLARLAEEDDCTILSVIHLNKGRGGSAIQRVQGSIDFTAAARSVLLVGSDPSEPFRKALIHVKTNVGPLGDSIGFQIDTGRFLWTGRSHLTQEEVLDGNLDSETRSAIQEAEEFLREVLSVGPVKSNDILKQARENGISESTLRRAKKRLRLDKEKGGMTGGWLWKLPTMN